MTLPSVLYRFGKKAYLDAFVTDGLVSFAPARLFNDSLLTEAQRDNEQERASSPRADRHQIHVATPGGTPQELSGVYDIHITYELTDIKGQPLRYYLACFTTVADPAFYDAFNADCYVEVLDSLEFLARLKRALKEQLPEWGGRALPVTYYATDRPIDAVDTLALIFMKDEAYKDQQEFRFLLLGPLDQMDDDRRPLCLGSLVDICRLHYK